jgi:UDP-N-acetylmuramate--alanine ligase
MLRIHLIGIGGAGLSAIATVLLQKEYIVSGSDIQELPVIDRLAKQGATIFIGHRPENLDVNPDLVIISSAISADNPELIEARRRDLPVVKRAEWLGEMMTGHVGIAVAGTHGKTTTTAMIAFILEQAGRQPTYIVGGFVPDLNSNAAAGQGEAFVVEADEYDHMFLGLQPRLAVLTIVEWDHPDIYPTPADFNQAFTDFARLVPVDGLIVGCGDDPGVQAVIKQARSAVIKYGLKADNDWQAINLRLNERGGYDFEVRQAGLNNRPLLTVSLRIPGVHNVYNALAALIVAYRQGVDLQAAAEILGRFSGVKRRFERKGEVNGIIIIDDYAHHPTEIKVTLAGARARYPELALWIVFQPHTFSRALALLDEFVNAFDEADHVIVVDIYASREKDEGLINSRQIVERMAHPDARYIGSLGETADYLVQNMVGPAVLLTFGAGDGDRVGEWVLERLSHDLAV